MAARFRRHRRAIATAEPPPATIAQGFWPLDRPMKRRIAIAVATLALLATGPVLADDSAEDLSQTVTLSPVALPIIVDGRLVNYVFVTAKVLLTPQADVITLRDKEPYFRDALVRAAHRTPFVLRNNYNHLDDAALKASLFRDAGAIVGRANVAGVQVVNEIPQHWLSAPR